MALRYCNKILDQFVRLYGDAIGPKFILMDNNALPHVTNVKYVFCQFVAYLFLKIFLV